MSQSPELNNILIMVREGTPLTNAQQDMYDNYITDIAGRAAANMWGGLSSKEREEYSLYIGRKNKNQWTPLEHNFITEMAMLAPPAPLLHKYGGRRSKRKTHRRKTHRRKTHRRKTHRRKTRRCKNNRRKTHRR
jgi:hypothetical protein